MTNPAYHLRPNKAVDRMLLVEVIRILERRGADISAYTYYGFGGPYLEEFRILYEVCPDLPLVSIEDRPETFKRQEFHLPCGLLDLVSSDSKTFINNYDSKDKKSIFWLDYTSLTYGNIADFTNLVTRVANESVVKITLPVAAYQWQDQKKEFERDRFVRQFSAIMPDDTVPYEVPEEFAYFVQKMIQIATQEVLLKTSRNFQPICSFHYSDNTAMFSLTGIVCPDDDVQRIRDTFESWQFANLDWGKPRLIDVPMLSTKERLHLARHLPSSDDNIGRVLQGQLGYCIEERPDPSILKMKQYADYHRYFPYFIRAVP